MHIRALLIALAVFATANPAAALDRCLIGIWRADIDDIATVMAAQMNGQARAAGGEVSMEISADGTANIIVDDLVMNVQVPNTPPMDVKVTGYSRGSLTGDDGAWAATTSDYNLVGSADVLGQRMTIPFSSATGMFGGGLGIYGCTADSVAFESTGDTPRMPRSWTRIR